MLKRLTTMPDDRITFDARAPRKLARAIGDLMIGFSRWRLAWALAWLDIRNRYRGSVLGPLWLSLSTGIMLAGWKRSAPPTPAAEETPAGQQVERRRIRSVGGRLAPGDGPIS